jgi:asparagine synthase (glutamine-hydrolysing)
MIARVAEFGEGLYAGYGALFGVETRDPTGDSRIVEFCLSLPEDQCWRDGHERWLLRRAMRDRLPAIILENRTRGLQAADWFERMRDRRHEIAAELAALEASNLAREAIDLPHLRRLLDNMAHCDPSTISVMNAYRGGLEFGLMTGRFIRWFETS